MATAARTAWTVLLNSATKLSPADPGIDMMKLKGISCAAVSLGAAQMHGEFALHGVEHRSGIGLASPYFVGPCTGESTGFSPLTIRSTYEALNTRRVRWPFCYWRRLAYFPALAWPGLTGLKLCAPLAGAQMACVKLLGRGLHQAY
jgi:hypothetical protein